MRLYTQHISTKIAVSYDLHLFFLEVLEVFNPWGYNHPFVCDFPQLWPWLPVIAGYFYGIIHDLQMWFS
jgi:hypothetical protein